MVFFVIIEEYNKRKQNPTPISKVVLLKAIAKQISSNKRSKRMKELLTINLKRKKGRQASAKKEGSSNMISDLWPLL